MEWVKAKLQAQLGINDEMKAQRYCKIVSHKGSFCKKI